MTRMVASVGTPKEAAIALAGGADVMDFFAATPDVIRAGVAEVGGRRLVSASAGPAAITAGALASLLAEIAATGADFIKLAIGSGADLPDRSAVPATPAKLVAVLSADFDPALLPLLGRSGFAGAMIDTPARSLLDCIDIAHLLGFVEGCHAAGLLAGLAGSLETPDIPRLLVLAPDLLGFDNALRGPGGEIDLQRVTAVRGLIPPEAPNPEARDVDYRLLAARGYAPVAAEDVPVDQVFVEDLVLPVFIGAYARERNAPQNVRFAVNASVVRSGRTAEDMRDVFSYDLITDGIRMLIGSGHVTFVETLAERIAVMVLGHPRVTKVVVRVQKLETGSGTVGVEIERIRSAIGALDRPTNPPKLSLRTAQRRSNIADQ